MNPEQLGAFKLGNVIGSGGFGTVYKATAEDGSFVAVKVLAPHVDSEETLKRFEREGKIRIEHPNVVKVIDAGRDDGVSYIAFELLEGMPLNKRLESAPLSPPEVIDIGAQICAGLSAAHERSIVHRDLKPGNVFCCNDGTIKILDFGIARPMSQAGPQLTMAGSVIGTPGFLSPEQAKGESEIGAAADLWALGVILYQALSGVNPFIRTTAVATILAVVLEDAPPLGEGGEALPRGLAEVVQRCLKKEPGARWDDANSLAVALRGIDLAASLITGVPDSLAVSIPEDEQRVVAVLLASEVHDLPALDFAVREWGGAIIPVVGGAIGVFGGRTYEGDESARATRAALAARQAASFVAVAKGRAIGDGETIGGAAVRAVERAVEARLKGVAVDAAAARSLEGEFEIQPTDVDGVLEVSRMLSRRETGSFPVLRDEVPLLGREIELRQILDAASSAFDDRRAGVVFVSGPPGIGKSRLRAELERELRAREVTVLGCRGESHRRDVAFHLMGVALRSLPTLEPFFLNPTVGAQRRRGALTRVLTDTLGDATWARQSLDPLARLLGLPDEDTEATRRFADPQLLTDRVRIALGDLLGTLAEAEPVALVIDDAQWADEPSLRFVEELVARLLDQPLLVFIAARPELAESRPELLAGRDVIRVNPRGLRDADVATVVEALADRPLPEATVRAIASRTEGNPFFIEQIVRELAEQGLLDAEVEKLPIPVDVQGAVQSRLDHLPLSEKKLCKRASVFAGGFSAPALEALDLSDPGPHLAELTKRGLVAARGGRGPERGEREFRFRNALLAEVAYAMNSEAARKDLHARAAGYLERSGGAEPEDLGRHWERAGATERASIAFAQAARDAAERGDSRSVIRCAEAAARLGLEEPDGFDLALMRAEAHSFLGERDAQRAALDDAMALAEEGSQRARALTDLSGFLVATGQRDVALSTAERSVAEARAHAGRDVLAMALARQGWALLYAGRVAEASGPIGEASRMTGLAPETAAHVFSWRAQLFSAMGDLGKRKTAYDEVIRRFRELGHLRRLAAAECNLADTLNRVGAYEEAEAALREAVRSAARVGNRVVEGYALVNLGYALAGQDRLEDALATFDEALAIAEALQRPRLAVAVRLYRARARLHSEEPAALAKEALAVAEEASRTGLPSLVASAKALRARALLLAGDTEASLVEAQAALALRDEIGTIEEDESEIFLALAEALLASGDRDGAAEVVARGASRLEFLAGRIEDASWRARFLTEVASNRRLIELDGSLSELV